MAKIATKSGGTSRIRFVLFDAEVAEGEIGQITQAIQNALRGPIPVATRSISHNTALKAPEVDNLAERSEPDLEHCEEVFDGDVAPGAPTRPRAPRKPAPKPTVIKFDIASDPPLSALADPKSNHKRYLKLAAWLHDHREIEAITADHIYTCYRHLGWPINISDFAQPFRELKHKQYFTTPERGKYAINRLDLASSRDSFRLMQLHELVEQDPGFERAAPKERSRLFAWWLHTYCRRDLFGAADTRICFDKIHLTEPPALATYLTRMFQAKELLKERGQYKLSRSIRADLDKKHGAHHSVVAVSKLLTDLLGKVSDLAEQNFLAEAIKCYRSQAYRASIVMVWNLTYAHLIDWVLNDTSRLASFNANIVKRNSRKIGIIITKYVDFEELKERETIDICNISGLYNKNIYRILVEKLDRRNIAAHPSAVIIVQSQADDAITDLVNNIVLGLV